MIEIKELYLDSIMNTFFIPGGMRGRIDLDKVKFNYFLDYKPDCHKLYVFFPGAYQRKKGTVQFQRYSWAPKFDGSVLILDDPTINEENSFSLGWFQGLGGGSLIPYVEKIIRKFSKSIGVNLEDVIMFGSSAGGFVSLKLAEKILESSVVCINPQINILCYFKSHVEKMLAYSYGAESLSNLNKGLADKYLTISFPKDRVGAFYYFQNVHDNFHVQKHLNYFLDCSLQGSDVTIFNFNEDAFSSGSLENLIYYDDPVMGHRPPGIDGTLNFFKYIGILQN